MPPPIWVNLAGGTSHFSWLRDYVYIPLVVLASLLENFRNLFLTFWSVVSGMVLAGAMCYGGQLWRRFGHP